MLLSGFDIPDDVLLTILTQADLSSVLSIAQVSAAFNALIRSPYFWYSVCKRYCVVDNIDAFTLEVDWLQRAQHRIYPTISAFYCTTPDDQPLTFSPILFNDIRAPPIDFGHCSASARAAETLRPLMLEQTKQIRAGDAFRTSVVQFAVIDEVPHFMTNLGEICTHSTNSKSIVIHTVSSSCRVQRLMGAGQAKWLYLDNQGNVCPNADMKLPCAVVDAAEYNALYTIVLPRDNRSQILVFPSYETDEETIVTFPVSQLACTGVPMRVFPLNREDLADEEVLTLLVLFSSGDLSFIVEGGGMHYNRCLHRANWPKTDGVVRVASWANEVYWICANGKMYYSTVADMENGVSAHMVPGDRHWVDLTFTGEAYCLAVDKQGAVYRLTDWEKEPEPLSHNIPADVQIEHVCVAAGNVYVWGRKKQVM